MTKAHLNLGHVGAAAPAAASPATRGAGSRAGDEHRDDDGSHVARPGKPEEGNRGLGLTAALGLVVCAIGDLIAPKVLLEKNERQFAIISHMHHDPRLSSTYLVAARVASKLRSECDGSTEEENAVQRIEDDHDDRVAGPVDIERGRN